MASIVARFILWGALVIAVSCDAFESLSCKFDTSTCAWTDLDDRWSIGNSTSDRNLNWRPIQGDHLHGSGGYLYLDPVKSHSSQSEARLTSTELTGDAACLTFWYYMFGLEPGILYIDLVDDSTSDRGLGTTIWRHQTNHGRQWTKTAVNVELDPKRSKLISFGAYGGENVSGDELIAIDDFIVTPGQCSSDICDFETSKCYAKLTISGATWIVSRAEEINDNMVKVDHTTGTPYGRLAFAKGHRPQDSAILTTTHFNHTGDRCLTFWYTSTANQATFGVYRNYEGQPSQHLWFRNHNYYGEWRKGVIDLPAVPADSYKVEFRVFFGAANDGIFAFDDLEIELDTCPRPVDCDFGRSLCQWTTSSSHETFDWIRMNGALLQGSNLEGPQKDGSNEDKDDDDFYLYAFFSPSQSEKTAIIDSGDFNVNPGENHYCLSFNVYAVKRAKLALFVETLEQDELRPVLSLRNTELPDRRWDSVSTIIAINYTQLNNDFSFIRLRASYISEEEPLGPDGKPLPHPFAALAIDDISIQEGLCQDHEMTTQGSHPTHSPINNFACDFENDKCPLIDTDQSNSHWHRRTAIHVAEDVPNVPKVDHTFDLAEGHFLFSAQPTQKDEKNSELTSQTIKAIGSMDGGCLSFWYYIKGDEAVSLSIETVDSSRRSTLIWTRKSVFADYWSHGYVNVKPSASDFFIKFIAHHNDDLNAGIALDDIIFTAGECPQMDNVICDFEHGTCGFDNGNVYKEIWKLVQGTDYTTETPSGSFIRAEYTSVVPVSGEAGNGYLFYDQFIENEFNCIQFAYRLKGTGKLSLIVSLGDDDQSDTILWSIAYSPDWSLVRLPLPFVGSGKVIAYHYNGTGTADLDDIKLLTQCQPLGYCNFEIDTCGWTSSNPDNADAFKRERGSSGNKFFPPNDITTQKDSGFYAISSFTGSKASSDKYSLTSPLISPTIFSNYCLSYWYYQSGKGLPPTLHAILVQLQADGKTKSSYLKSVEPSSRKNVWTRSSVQIDESVAVLPFSIEFRASVKSSTNKPAVIAIDDIELYPGLCADSIEVTEEHIFWCDSKGTNLTGAQLCDFYPDCADGWDESNCGYNCDFETGSCGWQGGVKPDSKLTIIDTAAMTRAKPNYETTFNKAKKGSYWKLNTKTSTTLTYLSPVMRNSGENCTISFHLYMSIAQDSRTSSKSSDYSKLPHLSIGLIDLHTEEITPIHNIIYSLGLQWYPIRVHVGRVTSDFRLRFEVRTKKGADVIAIDEIRADNCARIDFNETVLTDSCSSDQFYCSRTRHCIDSEFTCDYRDDCGDGEDEQDDTAECNSRFGRCDFNEDLCSWSTQLTTNSSEKWRVVDYDEDLFDSRFAIPYRDHSLNSPSGRYLINTGVTDSYSLVSPYLFRTDAESLCSLNFYYQFTDSQSIGKVISPDEFKSSHDYLEVQIVLPHLVNSRNTLETITGSFSLDSPRFKRAKIDIGPEVVAANRLFHLAFSAVRSSDSDASWAIDDVSFSPDCGQADCYLRCENGSCIGLDKRCDFTPHCEGKDKVSPDEADCSWTECPFGADETCNWDVIRSNSTLNWKLYQPSSDPLMANRDSPPLPQRDATSSDPSGWLMLFDSRDSFDSGQAQLMSQMIGRSSAQCSLQFNYFCDLNKCDLTVYLETDFERPGVSLKRLWEPHRPSLSAALTDKWSAKWRTAKVFIGPIRYGRILIAATDDLRGEHVAIGLDDLSFVNCPPPQPSASGCDTNRQFQCSNDNCIDKTQECDFVDDCLDGSDEHESCTLLPGRCDFESSCSAWKADTYRYERFSRISWAQTPDLPSYDHTLGTSVGTYLSLSGAQKPVDLQARHYSEIINGSISSDCALHLWLNIIDHQSTSQLTVYQRFNYSSNGYQKLVQIEPSYIGDYWQKYSIEIPNSQENYQIVLEGFIASNNDASINIDDITLTGNCRIASNDTTLPGIEEMETTTTSTVTADCYEGYRPCLTEAKCYPITSECDFVADCDDGTDETYCPSSCTFENGFCFWTNGSDVDQGQWLIEHATREMKDHTQGDGSYSLVSFKGRNTSPVILKSPVFSSSGPRCAFRFYYYKKNDKKTSLEVKLNYESGASKTIYSAEGGNHDQWYLGQVNVGQLEEPFSISIEAKGNREAGTSVLEAIDDIAFENCQSDKKSVMEDCPKNQWECGSSCISANRLCDGFNDCSAGEDEKHCPKLEGNCDFEVPEWLDFCGWTEVDATQDICVFSVEADRSIKLASSTIWFCESTVISPLFPAMIGDSCHFTFQYKTKANSGRAEIKIGLLTDDYEELYRFKGIPIKHDWQTHHVAVNSSQDFKVSISTTIDDDAVVSFRSFRFSPNCLYGTPLTLESFRNFTEPWEPSTTKKPVTRKPSPEPTYPPTTLRPQPPFPPSPEPTQRPTPQRPGTFTPSPEPLKTKHRSASIVYISFGSVGFVLVGILAIYLLLPLIERRCYYRPNTAILDDRFDDDLGSAFDSPNGSYRGTNENVFHLRETKSLFRDR